MSTVPTPLTAAAPEHHCTARKAVRFYSRRLNYWRAKMGAGRTTGKASAQSVGTGRRACPRYLAHVLQRKAHAARLAYGRWLKDEYHWQRWMPRLWYAIGMCETGLDWHFDSGTYVSAFGIIRSAFPTWNGNNSPREQYEVAVGIANRYGLGAWGCYSHGGYRYQLR